VELDRSASEVLAAAEGVTLLGTVGVGWGGNTSSTVGTLAGEEKEGGTVTVDHPGITVLETDDCLDLLRTQVVGRLVVSIAEHPDIFPINYVVDRGRVVFRTAHGTKMAGAVLGRGVAFEVDGYVPSTGEAWSVVVKGRAVEVEKMHEFFDALDLPLFPWHAAPKHHFVRIEPVEITGRRFHVVDKSAWDDPYRGRPRTAPE
jgi:nitroimidazol reductase NimA-like FMN-containing flavoprotein (pyridoxamine 5'-phosphate oxidase superfamily)